MIYSYLFEAKSIQAYLFQSGKLKDAISASERLDRMIDSHANSLLCQMLDALKLTHDLTSVSHDNTQKTIAFLRCKGGAFYASSTERAALVSLRGLWTLTIQQAFPGLAFTDALGQGETLIAAVEQGHELMAHSRNLPQITLPYASAFVGRDRRTGKAAVPVTKYAAKASLKTEVKTDGIALGMDLDTELHRQAYTLFDLRGSSGLQDRFTPPNLRPRSYPINLDDDFTFNLSVKDNDTNIKDIALIHIDGNGLGLLLRQLKYVMSGKTDAEYRIAFRAFSEAVNKATELAAQQATAWFATQLGDEIPALLPMRPLVLGGDDVTLLCHAKYALRYAEQFCRAFNIEARLQLKPLSRDYGLNVMLTASGGVVYHKAGHPFIQSHYLVEALCKKAKSLTKSMVAEGQTGPAALACYRTSQVLHTDIDEAIALAHSYRLQNNTDIVLANVAYLVDATADQPSWELLRQIVRCCSKAGDADEKAFTLSRWRQMASALSQQDFDEAHRIFNRGLALANKNATEQKGRELLDALQQLGFKDNNWFKQCGTKLYAPIVDLLNLAHFEENQEAWNAH